MTFRTGAKLGIYEIVGSLGSGGMGEVYRARDTNLKRDVAIKVLPESLSRDSQRVSRLRREAEVLASLSHPHIATIYALGDVESSPFLVLELVEGATLADRIARQPLPLNEALRIAGQIAEALESAHDKGIVHRDLKPANINIDADGNVKVLDFGLATIRANWNSASDQANAPTALTTVSGTIAGTPAYMSPEQATGGEVGRAADVWAFGCILYEMITGHVAFQGNTVSEILANVLKSEPEWERIPAEASPRMRRLLRRCLQKDEKLRLRDIHDVRLEIDDVVDDGPEENDMVSVPSRRRERWLWAAVVALAILAVALGARSLRRQFTAASEYRLEINTEPSRDSSLAISPDGLKIVFAAKSGTQSQLWLRSLDSSVARPLPGTERGTNPFWSPDSRSIAFFADSYLKCIDIDGGLIRTLANAPVPIGGDWNKDGTIIFPSNPGGPVSRIAADGGETTAATRVEANQRGHFLPRFLPDGRHFLFFVGSGPTVQGVYVGQLGVLETHRLFESATPAFYVPSGHLIFVRAGKLLVQEFDAEKILLKGSPVPIAEGVSPGTSISVSSTGVIAYRTPPPDSGQRQLVWIDRSGKELDREVYPDNSAIGPSLSRDGRRIAVYRFANGNMDIWAYEIRRRAWDRITFEAEDEIYPLWSPDGSSLAYGANRRPNGVIDLYRRSISAPNQAEEQLLVIPDGLFPMDWSADGRWIVCDTFNVKTGNIDILAISVDGDRKPFEVVQTNFNETMPQFSPDGKWIAYQSDKTGRYQIYLRPFPGPGADVLLSNNGGGQVRWNPNGKELFYVAADDRLMAVPIRFLNDKSVEPGTPVPLFVTNVGSTANLVFRQQYMVAPDGTFVMNSAVAGANSSPITVILNWKPSR